MLNLQSSWVSTIDSAREQVVKRGAANCAGDATPYLSEYGVDWPRQSAPAEQTRQQPAARTDAEHAPLCAVAPALDISAAAGVTASEAWIVIRALEGQDRLLHLLSHG